MKLGISCNVLGYSGGIERYALDLVDGMAALGIRPTFFARAFDDRLAEYRQIEPQTIAVNWLPSKVRDHAFAWRLRQRQRAAGVDALIGCCRVRSAEIPICGGTHIGFLRAVGKRPSMWDRWQIDLERAHYASGSLIVAHSKLVIGQLLEHYGVPAAKIRLIYPPTRGEKFRTVDAATRRALRQRLGFPEDRLVFAFPSSGHERKGFGLLAEFFTRTELPVMLAVASRRPIPTGLRNIRYIGFHQDIECVYQAADYTILASYYEPFGLVGTESVLCGTPAVLARNIGCAEVIADSAKIQFEPGDLASLRSAIETAVARARSGSARIEDPTAVLRCPTGTADHVQAILSAYAELRPGIASVSSSC